MRGDAPEFNPYKSRPTLTQFSTTISHSSEYFGNGKRRDVSHEDKLESNSFVSGSDYNESPNKEKSMHM